MATNRKPAPTEDDPFEDYEPPAPAGQVKLAGVGDWVKMTVTEVGEPFDAEFGPVFHISGTLEAKGGPTVEAPEPGEEASYLIGWTKKDGKPAHVREETMKAIKAAGRRDGSIRPGDVIAWKRDKDVSQSKGGKRFANPFRHHIVKVFELGDGPDASDPWGKDDFPLS